MAKLKLHSFVYGLLAAAVPILIGALVLAWRYDASYADLIPWWNDEWFYWKQAQSWRVAGLQSGYFTFSEATARFSWTPYYTWGPFIVMLHSLGGTGLNSVVLVNMAVLLLGSGLGAWAAGADVRRTLALALMLALFAPLFLYLPTSYQEVVHYGIALALAGGFARLLEGKTQGRGVLIVFILGASLLRSTWAFMLLPAFLIGQSKPTNVSERRVRLLRWGTVLLLTGLCGMAYSWNGAPYPNFFVWFLANPQLSELPKLIQQIWRNISNNAGRILFSRHIEEVLQIFQMLVLLTAVIRRRYFSAHHQSQSIRDEWGLHVYQLLYIFLLPVVVYHIGNNSYRLIAPHLLLSLALLIWHNRSRLALGIVLPFFPLFPLFLDSHSDLIEKRLDEPVATQMAGWQAMFADKLSYQPGLDRWCNSVTASFRYVQYNLTTALLASIPHGMGMSWLYWEDEFVPQRFRAGYLLLTDDDAQRWADRLNIEPLLEVEGDTLYRNLDANCP